MGDGLTGVTLGGFGGRSPHPLLFFPSFLPPLPLWLSPLAVGSEARTQLGVFQNKFPLQLLLITVIIFII